MQVNAILNRHIGYRIRSRRQFMCLTSERLAFQLGASVAMLEAFESGEARVGVATLLQLKDLLGVSLRYFFSGPYDFASAGVLAPPDGDLGRD